MKNTKDRGEKRPQKKTGTKVKDFMNDEDIKESDSMTKDKSFNIKIKEGEKAPIYFLKSQFADGYSHWVQTSSGDKVRVPCCGGAQGGGRAPDECPICKYVNDLYNRASKTNEREAKSLREEAKDMRASYEMYFIAAKGSETVVKIEGNKHKTKIDFEDPQVGLLRLSKAQYDTLRGLTTKYSFLVSNADLFKRYIILDKQVRNDDSWATLEMIPAEKPMRKPDVEIPEDVTLDGLFDVDYKLAKTTLSLHLVDDDEEDVDYENDEEGEDESMGRPAKKATKATAAKSNKVQAKKATGKAKRAVEEDDDSDDDDEYMDEGDSEEFDDSDDDSELDDDDFDADEEEIEDEEEDDSEFDDDDNDDEEEVESDEDDSEFDDDFLDDVDDDFEDDVPEEEPVVPKKKKGAVVAPKGKAVASKPVAGKRGRPAREEAPVAKPSRGRPAKASAPAPAPKPSRGRPAKVEAPAPKSKGKGRVVEEAPKKRGRPAKVVEAPAKSGKKTRKMDM